MILKEQSQYLLSEQDRNLNVQVANLAPDAAVSKEFDTHALGCLRCLHVLLQVRLRCFSECPSDIVLCELNAPANALLAGVFE